MELTIASVYDLPYRIQTVKLMIHIKDCCVGIVTQAPVPILQLGHGRVVFSHLREFLASDWIYTSQLPLLPNLVIAGIGLVSYEAAAFFRWEECPVDDYVFQINAISVVYRTIARHSSQGCVANHVIAVEPCSEKADGDDKREQVGDGH